LASIWRPVARLSLTTPLPVWAAVRPLSSTGLTLRRQSDTPLVPGGASSWFRDEDRGSVHPIVG
jgi:hypothetical protein